MYKRILVATDGSKLSNMAVEHALGLADITGAEVVALKVVPRYPQTYFEGGVALAAEEVKRIEKQWQDEAPGQAAGRPDTSVSAFRRAYVATSELHAVEPVWRPQPAEQDSAPRARLRRPLPRRVGRGPLVRRVRGA